MLFRSADGVSGPLKAKAISSVLVGGLFAAVIGPQLVIWTRDAPMCARWLTFFAFPIRRDYGMSVYVVFE